MYEHITYDKILRTLLTRIEGSVSKEEGSLIRTAIAPAAFELEKCYVELDVILNEVFADTASLESLKKIGIERGLSPYAAGHTIAKGRFNCAIPDKTRFSIGKYHYISGERLSETEHIYKLTCEESGSGPNMILGALTPIDYVYGLETSELTEIITPGYDEEDVEHFRNRFLSAVRKPSTSGNVYDYYNWALECSGIGAAKVFPLADGPGTVKIVITDEDQAAASPALVKSVQDYVEDRRPIGASVTVVSAAEKAINVTARIRLANGLNLGAVQDAFKVRLADYLRSNVFNISYISLARVGSLLLDTPGVEDFESLALNGASGNVEMVDKEIAVAGEVRFEVIP